MGRSVGNLSFNAECCTAGKLRYANNSNYKNDVMIRKEVFIVFSLTVVICCMSGYESFIMVVWPVNRVSLSKPHSLLTVLGVCTQECDGGTQKDHRRQ